MASINSKLVIDCQLFQGMTWHRGMGKYSLELLAHISQVSKGEMHLIFNSNQEIPSEVLETLKSRINNFSIHQINLEIVDGVEGWEAAAKINQKALDEYILRERLGSSDTTYLVLSLFEGEWVSCYPSDSTEVKKALIFYDLIPYLFHEHYFQNPVIMEFMLRKYRVIFEADIIFTISHTTAKDVVEHLGIPNRKVVSINGARITRKGLKAKKPECVKSEKFILMNTGDDFRKNNIRAVKAYEKFKKQHPEYSLIITSFFHKKSIKQIKQYSKNVIFSGNVSEEELLWLYQNAELVFFPTLYEGLGLPVLEAVDQNIKVACSDIPVFREISKTAFTYFDPYNIDSIENGLRDAVGSSIDEKEYLRIDKYYDWDTTARKFIDSIPSTKSGSTSKRKIAVVGPSPAGYSGISKVLERLHGHMLDEYKVDYYLEKSDTYEGRPSFLQYVAQVSDVDDFKGTDGYEKVIYHIGNSENHIATLKHCLRFPDTIVLHDLNLEGLFSVATTRGYLSSKRLALEERLSELTGGDYKSSLVRNQKSVIVHSSFAEKNILSLAAKIHSKVNVHKANLPIPVYCERERIIEVKSIFEVVGFGGVLSENKGVNLLELICQDKDLLKVKAVIFGYMFNSSKKLKAKLKNMERVELKSDLSDFEYEQAVEGIDTLIVFREPYNGETSYTVLEALRSEKKVIVKDVGWFSELPDAIVVKAKTGKDVLKTLKRSNQKMTPSVAQKLPAYQYVLKNHREKDYISTLMQ